MDSLGLARPRTASPPSARRCGSFVESSPLWCNQLSAPVRLLSDPTRSSRFADHSLTHSFAAFFLSTALSRRRSRRVSLCVCVVWVFFVCLFVCVLSPLSVSAVFLLRAERARGLLAAAAAATRPLVLLALLLDSRAHGARPDARVLYLINLGVPTAGKARGGAPLSPNFSSRSAFASALGLFRVERQARGRDRASRATFSDRCVQQRRRAGGPRRPSELAPTVHRSPDGNTHSAVYSDC